MSAAEPRLVWIQQAPEPGGPCRFEICRMLDDTGYALQMWQLRPEDWPLVVWEMDGYLLEEAKAKAERLANQRGPGILGG
jgi:hypothetical protein